MLKELNKTLSEITGDTDKPSWPEILKLLGMDKVTFRNDKEEALGLEFMQNLIEQNGKAWLRDNRYQAMSQWETQLDKHRAEQTRTQKRKEKRKEPLSTLFKKKT